MFTKMGKLKYMKGDLHQQDYILGGRQRNPLASSTVRLLPCSARWNGALALLHCCLHPELPGRELS